MCARIRARAGACVLATVCKFAMRSESEVNKRRILLSPEFYFKLTRMIKVGAVDSPQLPNFSSF